MNGFILDTNFISELRKPRPNKGCLDWFGRQDVGKLYLTTVTMAEIAQGIFMRELDAERDDLMDWFENRLPRQFAGRILTLDEKAVLVYGRIATQSRKKGLNRPVLDALIAAITLANNCSVVTRNKRDFDGLGVKIVNPFT
jgi:predicted nucleic acid-binding protein